MNITARTCRSAAVAALATCTLLATGGIAVADTIENTITVSDESATITAGGNVEVGYRVQSENLATDGEQGCNANAASPLTVTLDVPAPVAVSGTTLLSGNKLVFTQCGQPQALNWSSSTPGSYVIGASYQDAGTGRYTNQAQWTLKVVEPADNTAPSIAPNVSGTLGKNGWYTSDVQLTWTVTDPQTAVTSKSGCDDVSITADQAATTYTCTATSAGGTATESVTIKRDATAPEVTPVDVTAPGWRNSDLTQTFTATDGGSGLASSSEPTKTLTASDESADASTPTIDSYTWEDNAGNATTRTVSALIDKTAPGVSPDSVVDSTWRNTDLSKTFTSVDILSGLAVESDESFTLTASAESLSPTTPTVVSHSVRDNAGNVTTRSVSALIDKTGPLVNPGNVENATWRNTPLSEEFTAEDPLSGLASAVDATFTLTASAQSASGSEPTLATRTVSDVAGNSTTRTVSALIDLTKPTAPAFVGGPEGTTYWGSVPDEPTCTSSDALSGLQGDCLVEGYSTAVGTHTLTATATDKAGNSISTTRVYTVKPWTLSGFYSPVDMGNMVNTVKGGSTVPLKFELFVGTRELTDVSAVKSFVAAKVSCTTGAEDAIESVAPTGGTSLRYDTTGGQFIQNWKTPTGAGSCYKATMTAQDGSSISAHFRIK